MTEKKKPTLTQLRFLSLDKQFNERFSKDYELNKLWNAPKREAQDLLNELGLAIGATVNVENSDVFFKAPTPGILMILGVIQSPILSDSELKAIDVDVALFVFLEGKKSLNGISTIEDIKLKAAGTCKALCVEYTDVYSAMLRSINLSFASFDMLPSTGCQGRPCKFDLCWYTKFCSEVATATGIDAESVGWEMPLAMAANYMVASKHHAGVKLDYAYDAEAVSRRVDELVWQRIEDKGYE